MYASPNWGNMSRSKRESPVPVDGILQARILEWIVFPFSRGIFPTQGSNPGLLHCRRILYQLSHKGSPRIVGSLSLLEWVIYPFFIGSSWPWIILVSPALQVDSLPTELLRKPQRYANNILTKWSQTHISKFGETLKARFKQSRRSLKQQTGVPSWKVSDSVSTSWVRPQSTIWRSPRKLTAWW